MKAKLAAFLRRNRWRLLLAAAIAGVVVAFYALGFDRYLSLAEIHARLSALVAAFHRHIVLWTLSYFAVYVAITGLSLPLSIPITLLGGAVFGLVWGSLIVTVAATCGATLAFWAARFLFRDWVEGHFARIIAAIDRGIERDGIFYLFLLRLIPLFPFFAINLAMGVTTMRTWTYFWVTFVGMIPGTVLYVNAGVQLATVESVGDLFSPVILGSLAAIGLFPLVVKKSLDYRQRRRDA